MTSKARQGKARPAKQDKASWLLIADNRYIRGDSPDHAPGSVEVANLRSIAARSRLEYFHDHFPYLRLYCNFNKPYNNA